MFDSLLARLKCDVSNVSAVQASDSKAFACNGSATADVSGVSETRLRAEPDTADTACNGTDVSPEPAPIGACTSDTADTAEKPTRQADAQKVGADDTPMMEPFDREAFEERAGICEFDGGLSREDAEAIAWHEDDRRRCTQCQNRRAHDGVCRIAEPKAGALVVPNRSYTPDPVLSRRCEGYAPKASDTDQRAGAERWPGLREVAQ